MLDSRFRGNDKCYLPVYKRTFFFSGIGIK